MKERLLKLFHMDQSIMLLVLIVLCVILSFIAPNFATMTNMLNILRQASMAGICAIGMTMLILLGGIDISVGSAQGTVGVITVVVILATGNVLLGVVSGIVSGAFIGLVTAFVVTKMKLNPLIATLGMMSILRGAVLVGTNGISIQIINEEFLNIGIGHVAGIPIPVIIWILLIVIFWFTLSCTSFGRKIYAVGGNEKAAKLSGIHVERIKVLVYVLSGILAAVAAIILASRMNSGQPTAGDGFEMTVIASVVVGGVSMSGGRGSLAGAMVGTLIFQVLANGLILLDINSFWQNILRGALIIIAVYIDEHRKEKLVKEIINARFNTNEVTE
jgi:ribose transport system permease protein